MAQISTIEQLTAIIPDMGPTAAAKTLDHLDDQALGFIVRCPFMLLATEGPQGLEISPKGDDPGFAHVLDDKTLLLPERPGNHLKMGLRNILANGRIGLLFLCPPTGDALRITGRASLHDDAALCGQLSSHGKPALLAIRVEIERAFFHCPRAILRSGLWKPETWGEPMRISMGRIIGKALGKPEVAEPIDRISDERNAHLWE
jgi:uncharacterized protein